MKKTIIFDMHGPVDHFQLLNFKMYTTESAQKKTDLLPVVGKIYIPQMVVNHGDLRW